VTFRQQLSRPQVEAVKLLIRFLRASAVAGCADAGSKVEGFRLGALGTPQRLGVVGATNDHGCGAEFSSKR
jgi:hypothetical protein